MKSNILEINKYTTEDIKNTILSRYEKYKNLNSTITFLGNNINFNNKTNALNNVPYSLKDIIITESILTTAGSKYYSNFIPKYNAELYDILQNTGAVLIGKDSCDEFASGGSGKENFAINENVVKNFHNSLKTTAGSSSGSCNKVASGEVVFAITTDSIDSTRIPAAYCGIVGFKPTYGSISRHGIFQFISSMDTVGIAAQYVKDVEIVAKELFKKSSKDFTSIENSISDISKPEHVNFVIFNEFKQYIPSFLIDKLIELGHNIEYINLNKEIAEISNHIYPIIAYPEMVLNHELDTSIQVNDQNTNRNNGYSNKFKTRIILGQYIIEKIPNILEKAKKIRNLIKNYLDNITTNKIILTPSFIKEIPNITDATENDLVDGVIKLCNYNGGPSIVLPYYEENKIKSLCLIGKIKSDQEVLNTALLLEEILNFEQKNSWIRKEEVN
ncbi:MAG: hypothetical protein LBH55_00895 [Mycoplasmataceae bacterium]|nr:hypothetical protein [Mycoplasmataceae bacterium]